MMKPFKFKQFQIEQDRCAMKVGTDGVLLGAWASLGSNPDSILDIGGGTGLIALMIAQRSTAETIDALEIDEDAYEQCVSNFDSSDWADRLFCYHAGLDEFVEEWEEPYDLILSNPPFYSEEVSSGDDSRDKARQNQSLPFDELLEGVSKLMAPKGSFATIIPFKEEETFLKLANSFKLYPQRITRVKGTPSSEIKRSLIQFGFEEVELETSELTIEIGRHEYTEDYISLTKDFYLKM
ncbi:tRNA1(Val) (adenine(37)-N6)-methyltransferase [Zobellia barbeyronii]|uniref:tRNA1(Val) (adenine(37)-N6)-methyltransferase n=1 Tax=Zobellia barbeyronii TaxID=2748009 RepID=A0ABS5WGX0_9FLAO|nr:methyltransferase [Zobellia barbeyronii]MBT2162661.1 methyltransferase [Zobellia barbeyronii]